jgi:WD40 repeat protein
MSLDIENLRVAWRYWVDAGDLDHLNKLADSLWLLYDARGWHHATIELTTDLLNVLSSTPSTRERAMQEVLLRTSLARTLMAVHGYTGQVQRRVRHQARSSGRPSSTLRSMAGRRSVVGNVIRSPGRAGLPAVALAIGMVLGSSAATSETAAAGGPQLWAARYTGPVPGYDIAEDLAVSPDGSRVFVTGLSDGGGTDQDYATAAYNAGTGEPVWAARYDGPGHTYDAARAVAVSPDGSRVFVTGEADEDFPDNDYITIAYDATSGANLWTASFEGFPNYPDRGLDVGVSPDGSRVFVTGESTQFQGGEDYMTVAYAATTGQQLWATRYRGVGGLDTAHSLVVAPDGSRVYVTGESLGESFDYATLAYDAATGQEVWEARYDGPIQGGWDSAYAIAITPDGSRIFVTGESQSEDPDYATVAYDAVTGALLGVARYDGPNSPPFSNDRATDVAVSPDGIRVFVTGYSYRGSSPDYTTIGYDVVSGTRLWITRYDGPAGLYDSGEALAVTPDGRFVIVTGQSSGGSSDRDYATVAYRATTGVQLGVARYNGPGNEFDWAHAVVLSPDGMRAFVTGESDGGNPTLRDYATVAYERSSLTG